MDYFLTSERLGFRTWDESDLPLALALWSDPDVMRWLGGPYSEEYIREKLQSEIEMQKTLGIQYWPIFELASGRHAGVAGLKPWQDETDVYEVGVHIHRAFWSSRMGEEAARTVINHAFAHHKAKALIARHHANNTSSQALIQRLGFTRTGETYWHVTDAYHPTYRMEAPTR